MHHAFYRQVPKVARALGAMQSRRQLKVALPLFEEKDGGISAEDLAKRIHERTEAFTRRATHLQRQPFNKRLHSRLAHAAEDVCDFLVRHLETYARVTNAGVIGASAHSLSLMQDTLWESSLIPNCYDALLAHVWKGANRHVGSMSATDASSMIYAFYAFRDFLGEIHQQAGIVDSVDGQKRSVDDVLLIQLLKRFEVVMEMGTSQDAVSVLLGMAAVRHKDERLVQKLLTSHILPQVPIANHEILGLIAWAIGQLKPKQATKVLDPLCKRFMGLKSVEYATMEIETFANLLCGLGGMQHKNGKALASKMIQFIDRAGSKEWRPRAIGRLAWGVAQLDSHTPSFVGKILRETIKSGRFFIPAEVKLFQEAIDEMNVEPTDKVWESLAQRSN